MCVCVYNDNETFGSDTLESRADVRLDLSQNNKLNSVAYAYVHEIVSNICWLLLYILVKECIDIWDVELKVRFIYIELWLI